MLGLLEFELETLCKFCFVTLTLKFKATLNCLNLSTDLTQILVWVFYHEVFNILVLFSQCTFCLGTEQSVGLRNFGNFHLKVLAFLFNSVALRFLKHNELVASIYLAKQMRRDLIKISLNELIFSFVLYF